jgi:predicted transcriptional regulator of viral defense system
MIHIVSQFLDGVKGLILSCSDTPLQYAIASRAAPDAYVAYHSAFEYHGLANQVYYDVFVATQSRFREFEHDGITYRRVQSPYEDGIEAKADGVRVTDLERTVVDGIGNFEKSGGLEELLIKEGYMEV